MNHTVIGIFDTEQEATRAVDQLINSGLSRSNIDSCSRNALNDEGSDTKLTNFFGSVFDKDDDVKNHYNVASKGCTVTVHATSSQEAQLAAEVMDQYGAVDVDERAMQFRGNTEFGQTTGAAASASDNAIPVIEEELQVGKRVVQTGGVRLRSRIIERQVEEHLRLREEHVYVERNPVNQSASPSDIDSFREETIEMRETAEVPLVNKEARVVEEVSLTKEVEEHDEVIKDSVRHTEVDVEDLHGKADLDADRTSFKDNLHTATAVGTDTEANFLDKSHDGWKNALHRMREIEDDYKVASDDPDVRGWNVTDSANSKIGVVEELIVDTNAMKVRYLEVKVKSDLLNTAIGNDHRILIPIGAATLDHSQRNVLVSTFNQSNVASYPAYTGGTITRDYEHGLLSALSPNYKAGSVTNDQFYEGEHFSNSRFGRSTGL
jgi:uncharacterized protein (TIGR02271 family)